MKRERMPEISVVNVILCMFVVFIHVTAAPVTALDKGSAQYAIVFIPWRLAGFCMQGFVFLAGLRTYLNKPEKPDYKAFYRSRLIKILLPYLVFNVVYYVFFVVSGYFPFSAADLFRYMLNGTLVSPFYFIIVIVQYYALSPLWHKLITRVNPLPALVFTAVFTMLCKDWLPELISFTTGRSFIYNDRIFTTYLFYWLAGAYAGIAYDDFKNLIRSCRVGIAVVFIVFGAANAVFSYLSFSRGVFMGFLEAVHYIYCVSAVLCLCAAAITAYERRTLKNRLVRELDAASYNIFLVHCLVITLTNSVMPRLGVTDIGAQYLIRVIVVYTVSPGACILWRRFSQYISKRVSFPVRPG